MVKNHLKRLTIPRTWNIKRKTIRFAIRPKAGKSHDFAISLGTFLKELTSVCQTSREVKALLQNKKVQVDGKFRHDIHFPVGLFETVALTDSKTAYRLTLDNKGRLTAMPCKDSTVSLCKVVGKTSLRKGKTQLNGMNSKNITVDKDEYKTGDVLVLKDNKIAKHLKFEKGMLCVLIAGKHAGTVATIKDIKENMITVTTSDDEFDTLRDYAFLVGQKTPEITLRGETA